MGMPIRSSVWTVRDKVTKEVHRVDGIIVHGEGKDAKEIAQNDYYISRLYDLVYTKDTKRDRKQKARLMVLRIELSPVIVGHTQP